ncbi:DUF2637 domain-containing protein [Mycolicibacterium smegmatis]|uniref:DUF2637 domain-containing protein n=1 Tax=Mycolicibacterium smegmatis TaxID=1772 RepID=UPI001EFAAD4E|nr:DUF2637 domain-containing protein [Mycolicibacterium smegmatis]ULN33400.1 DUF2637 domain-containing protein [Mycolicibacterium smegmatis]ULN68460.1 DUF2637 domain-containing protein [Mycolicibacterium smegmatis]
MKRIDRDKVAPGVAAVGTLAVGGLAFALSFTALSELAAANGVAQAEMVPLVVDSRGSPGTELEFTGRRFTTS